MTETWASSIETMAEMNCVVGHVVSYRNGQMTINLVWMAQMGQLSTLAFYRKYERKDTEFLLRLRAHMWMEARSFFFLSGERHFS